MELFFFFFTKIQYGDPLLEIQCWKSYLAVFSFNSLNFSGHSDVQPGLQSTEMKHEDEGELVSLCLQNVDGTESDLSLV